MFKKVLGILAVLALTLVAGFGCAGTNYVTSRTLDNGLTVTQGGRTGVFGTDNSFVHIQPQPVVQYAPDCTVQPAQQGCQPVYAPQAPVYAPTPPVQAPVYAPVYCAPGVPAQQGCQQPVYASPAPVYAKKILLEKTYRRSATSWEGCPDPTPNKRAKNIRREEVWERGTDEVLAPQPAPVAPVYYAPAPPAPPAPQPQSQIIVVPQQQAPPVFGFTGNSSVGNILLPAVAIGSGMVGAAALKRPDNFQINNANAQQQGQRQRNQQQQGQTAKGGAATAINANTNKIGIKIK